MRRRLFVLLVTLASTGRCYCGADGPPRPPLPAPPVAPQPVGSSEASP